MPFDSSSSIRVGLVLVEMYPFYGAILSVESMRLANKYGDRKVFDWVFISEDGDAVAASNGMSLATVAATSVEKLDYVFVVAGYDQSRRPLPHIKALLRRLSCHGTVVGAVDSGAFLLAEAGLLKGKTAAVHFESVQAFQNMYPRISVSEAPVSISSRIMTCASGTLVVRLILFVARERVGELIAGKVEADLHLLALAPPRDDTANQFRLRARLRLKEIVALMQNTLETPMSLRDLAERSGYSVRQLTRAFNDRFSIPPMKYYQRLRLERARQLLYQGEHQISQVSLCCGFTALSVFSRAYKMEFGQAPSRFVATFRREGFSRIIPPAPQRMPLNPK